MIERPDPLHDVFEELRASVVPAVRAPGITPLLRTVRRRRVRNRSILASVLVLVVAGVVTAMTGVPMLRHTPSPLQNTSVTAVPTLASPLPSPSESPSAGPSVTPGSSQPPPVTTTSDGTTSGGSTAGGTTAGGACAKSGFGKPAPSGLSIVETWPGPKPPCAGVEERVFFVTYKVAADGSGGTYASNWTNLDRTHLSATLHVEIPGSLCATVIIGHDDYMPPMELAAGTFDANGHYLHPTPDPFRDRVHRVSAFTMAETFGDCGTPTPSDSPS